MIAHLAPALVLASAVVAQGKGYAFAERAPATLLEQVIDRHLASVVKVHGASGLSTITPYASGVVVSARGHILTLDAVLLQEGKVRVVLADGSVHPAELLPPDTDLGVRLIKIDETQLAEPLRPLQPAESLPQNGTFVASIGNCFRLAEFSEKLSATFGVVTATASTGLRQGLGDVDYAGDLILTDAPNNPGQFGGALITLDGQWVGLNTRIVESTETNTQLSAAVPARDLRAYLARWIDGVVEQPREAPVVRPVRHGIVLFDQGGRTSPPAYVERVEKDSPAAAAGIRADDLIVKVDGATIRTCAEFADALTRCAPGQVIELTLKRGTAVQKVSLTLAEAAR